MHIFNILMGTLMRYQEIWLNTCLPLNIQSYVQNVQNPSQAAATVPSAPLPQSSIRRLFTCSSEPRVQDKADRQVALIAPPPVGQAVDGGRHLPDGDPVCDDRHRPRSLCRAFAAASTAASVIHDGSNPPLTIPSPTAEAAAAAAAAAIKSGMSASLQPIVLGAGRCQQGSSATLRGWDSRAREDAMHPPLMLGAAGRQGSSSMQGWSYDDMTIGEGSDGGAVVNNGGGVSRGGTPQEQGLLPPRVTILGGSDDGGVIGWYSSSRGQGPCSPRDDQDLHRPDPNQGTAWPLLSTRCGAPCSLTPTLHPL